MPIARALFGDQVGGIDGNTESRRNADDTYNNLSLSMSDSFPNVSVAGGGAVVRSSNEMNQMAIKTISQTVTGAWEFTGTITASNAAAGISLTAATGQIDATNNLKLNSVGGEVQLSAAGIPVVQASSSAVTFQRNIIVNQQSRYGPSGRDSGNVNINAQLGARIPVYDETGSLLGYIGLFNTA